MKAGADAASASAAESADIEAESRGGKMDGMNIGREQGLSVTVYSDGGEGHASVGDFSEASAKVAVERALAIARKSAADPCAGLADKEIMAAEFPDLSLYHPVEISADEAFARARECEEAAWAVHPAINRGKSEGQFSASWEQGALANSHGFCAVEAHSGYSCSCAAIAEKDGQMERDGWGETRRKLDDLPPVAEVGKKAGEFAARRLGGRKAASGRAPVLFWTPASHSLFGHLVRAASGGALYQKNSWLLEKYGEQVCAPHISIAERPHLPGEMRSAAFDGDGVATAERMVVENGVWRGRFLSAYSARRLGVQTTANANGAHNLEVSGRAEPFQDLLRRMGTGLLVTDLMGSGVNPATGDYSRAATGFWVDKGEIAWPINEATIAGNLLEMLGGIEAIGDDAMRHGLFRCGSVLIPDMMIGGGAA